MATLQQIQQVRDQVQHEIDALRARERTIVAQANASGTPQWTDELREQVRAVRAEIEPIATRWNVYDRLERFRCQSFRERWEREELPREDSRDYSILIGQSDTAAYDAALLGDNSLIEQLDRANAKWMERYDVPAMTLAEFERDFVAKRGNVTMSDWSWYCLGRDAEVR